MSDTTTGATSTTGTGIYGVIAQAESGGQNILTKLGGTASGYYQITNPTWRDFAPQAGVDLSQYPTAMSAPADVQTSVANLIPLNRWAPATVSAVQSVFPGIDTSQTVGQLASVTGNAATAGYGGAYAGGQGEGYGSTAGYGGFAGHLTQAGFDPLNSLPSILGGPLGALGEYFIQQPTVPAQQPGGAGVNVGLSPGLTTDVGAWLNNNLAVPLKAGFTGLFTSAENWVGRGFLVLVGVVILAVALFALVRNTDAGKAAVSAATKGAQ